MKRSLPRLTARLRAPVTLHACHLLLQEIEPSALKMLEKIGG